MSEVRGHIGFLLAPQSKNGRVRAGQLDLDRPARELTRALKAAISAATAAQRFAKKKRFACRFDADCIWSMAESLLEAEDTDAVGTTHLDPTDDDLEDEEAARMDLTTARAASLKAKKAA
jgi:hypothetical protein